MSNLSSEVTIDGTRIGSDHPPYFIAEISGNHNGDIQKAKELIRLAKEAGASAVKLQTYTPDTMTIQSDKQYFKINSGLWSGYTLYDLYKWAHTPWEWHKELFDIAKQEGITIFSSPFDETSVDFLEELNVFAYKVASFELIDLPLIRYIAKKGKPMIMSTGMANLQEINEAVSVCQEEGNKDLVILHCVSGYPTPIADTNLRTIPVLADIVGGIVGLSDHTLSDSVAVASVALGARVIEKHFIKSRSDEGPDSTFSLEPQEFATLCKSCAEAFQSLGRPGFERKASEEVNIKFRRSIFFVKELKKGETIEKSHIRRIRPGYGIEPKHFDELIGRQVNQDIEVGTPVSWGVLN